MAQEPESSLDLVANMAPFGLPDIPNVPYGIHICLFYRDRSELTGALVPFVRAGLRNHERCHWVTGEPLQPGHAIRELGRGGVDTEHAIARGELAVEDYGTWFARHRGLRGGQLARVWLEEERRALNDGYRGLRVGGNLGALPPDEWQPYLDYEAAVNRQLPGRRTIQLCGYERSRLPFASRQDLSDRHHCCLEHPDEGWQVVIA